MVRGHTPPRPWRQSDLDKTCGIVSITNALRLCIGATVLGRRESEELFAARASYLLRRGFLRGILREGMGDHEHAHLLYFLCRVVERRYAIRLKVERPYRKRTRAIPIARLAEQMTEFFAARCGAILISFETAEYSHFTTIRAVSRSSLLLSDGEHARLPLKSCSTAASAVRCGYRYCIATESVIFLSRDPTTQ
jgi:hypothetical protein